MNKKIFQGCLMSVLIFIALIFGVGLLFGDDEEDNKTELNTSYLTLTQEEQEILDILKSSLTDTEMKATYGDTLDTQIGTVKGIELKPVGELSVAPQGTNSLNVRARLDEYDDLDKIASIGEAKTEVMLLALKPIIDKYNISIVQFDWILPTPNLDNLESIYYILRYDKETIQNNNLFFGQGEQLASYISNDIDKRKK